MRPTVAIVGVGLIGGSLGLAWRNAGAAKVIGVTRRRQNLDVALSCGAIDEGTTDVAQGVAAADVVVLCTPVVDIVALARSIVAYVRPGTLLTDVGSTKAWIMREISSFLPGSLSFVGGHPMAGSEHTGVEAADPYLFENAIYCLTPSAGMAASDSSMRLLQDLVRATGARPLLLTPDVHDLIVAGISHVPHLEKLSFRHELDRTRTSYAKNRRIEVADMVGCHNKWPRAGYVLFTLNSLTKVRTQHCFADGTTQGVQTHHSHPPSADVNDLVYDLCHGHTRCVDEHGIRCLLKRSDRPLAVCSVAKSYFTHELCLSNTQALRPHLLIATSSPRVQGRGKVDLDIGIGKDNRTNVSAVHDHATLTGEPTLRITQMLTHNRISSH
jgi:prephenate dehydrogenase